MTIYQLIFIPFALASIGLSGWAIVAIVRSKTLRWKPAWIVGSLLGTGGLGINWSQPDDIILLLGLMVPPLMVFKVLPLGPVLAKAGFPVIAMIALGKVHMPSGTSGRSPDEWTAE
ncbi:hypothetical protein WBP06_01665 [Novosphingobium sp. BL-8H]|uniref:hypothetical protein n=1 Tax=Novosphingobium sp. BL-8H TaxID=3127640 RepID=UPI003756D8FD